MLLLISLLQKNMLIPKMRSIRIKKSESRFVEIVTGKKSRRLKCFIFVNIILVNAMIGATHSISNLNVKWIVFVKDVIVSLSTFTSVAWSKGVSSFVSMDMPRDHEWNFVFEHESIDFFKVDIKGKVL